MGLKKYIFGSIILVLIIFAYIFSIEPGDYRIELFGYALILPIAVWIVLPVAILAVLSILHISYYGLKNYFTLKSMNKDAETLLSVINSKLLNETSKATFQNQNIKQVANILKQLDITVTNQDFSCEDEKIKKTADQIFTVNNGKYISNKELKLPSENPLMEKNLKNRIDQDENFALEALKKPQEYSREIIKKAYEKVLYSKSITTIKKLIDEIEFDETMVMELLKKDSEQDPQFAMTNEQIINLITKVNLNNFQLIAVANYYKSKMSPDQIIKLFEDLCSAKEEHMNAYLYVLAEYEMIDKVRDVLDNSGTDEYLPFKALVDLKDSGKNIYSLDSISYK
jgi:hypothetical protein